VHLFIKRTNHGSTICQRLLMPWKFKVQQQREQKNYKQHQILEPKLANRGALEHTRIASYLCIGSSMVSRCGSHDHTSTAYNLKTTLLRRISASPELGCLLCMFLCLRLCQLAAT
jgi:hydrogenase maturation factor